MKPEVITRMVMIVTVNHTQRLVRTGRRSLADKARVTTDITAVPTRSHLMGALNGIGTGV